MAHSEPHTHPLPEKPPHLPGPNGHAHAHEHSHHHHGHHHHHGATGNLQVAFFLNLGFTILEIFGGIFTNSVAILTDALHDLGDSLALGLAWYLEKYSEKGRDQKFNYGYARFSVLGAFINSIVLVVGSIFIMYETIPRLIAPEPTHAPGMVAIAVVGVLANGLAAFRLSRGHSLNERAVMLHLLEDVLGWVAILIGSVVMLFVDVPILDPILSLAIMAFILFNVFRNLRAILPIFLQGRPPSIDGKALEVDLCALERVCDVHDLHLWSLDGAYNIASLHLVLAEGTTLPEAEVVKRQARHVLQHFQIKHATIEIEAEGTNCAGHTSGNQLPQK